MSLSARWRARVLEITPDRVIDFSGSNFTKTTCAAKVSSNPVRYPGSGYAARATRGAVFVGWRNALPTYSSCDLPLMSSPRLAETAGVGGHLKIAETFPEAGAARMDAG